MGPLEILQVISAAMRLLEIQQAISVTMGLLAIPRTMELTLAGLSPTLLAPSLRYELITDPRYMNSNPIVDERQVQWRTQQENRQFPWKRD